MKKQVAIDGPAGAGKTTVAKAVAKRMQMNYLDTGAMYRAVAYVLLQKGVDLQDRLAIEQEMDSIQMEIVYLQGEQHVFVNHEDVTPYIRTPEVSMGASAVGKVPKVRIKLVELQRETARRYDIVMDGRDIGTYVLPCAKAKFYLTASSDVRAVRRGKDMQKAGEKVDFTELEKEIIARDKADSEREFAPLRCAEDAVYLDTSRMSQDEVIAYVCKKIGEIYG